MHPEVSVGKVHVVVDVKIDLLLSGGCAFPPEGPWNGAIPLD